jgi:hypothetical protein
MADRVLGRHVGQGLDFGGRSTEAGALEEMRGAVVIPVAGADGREIADP